jgi:hypothetical protein
LINKLRVKREKEEKRGGNKIENNLRGKMDREAILLYSFNP